MRTTILFCLVSAFLHSPNRAQEEATAKLSEPWTRAYVGPDATGDHVIALWQFDAGEEMTDSSGNGHDLSLNGAKIAAGGRFGGCLESWRGWPDSDVPHQAQAQAAPVLTPLGAFSVEMWIKPKPELEGYPDCFLLDNRYVDESGMQLILGRDSGAGRRLSMLLGIAGEHPRWNSDQYRFLPDTWYHVAFTYDGKGTGRFFINGTEQGGQQRPEYGAVTAGVKRLTIGDRVGSLYHGFPGYLDQVRICKGELEFRSATFDLVSPRRVFVRMEENAAVQFVVSNKNREPLQGATAIFRFGGLVRSREELPELPPGEQRMLDLPIDTSLRPDTYTVEARIEVPGDMAYQSTQTFPVIIVPRQRPDVMPVVMWGGALDQIDWLTELGFTHCLGAGADYKRIWEAGERTSPSTTDAVRTTIESLDKALASGIGVVVSLAPGRWARQQEELRQVDVKGQPVGEDVCGLFAELKKFCYNVGASVSHAYGDHPALQAALLHTEVRGDSNPCFHAHDREALEAATGLPDIPTLAKSQRGLRYQDIANFPVNRVIPDDDPLYVYYKWFWKQGDGWNAMQTALHEGLKSDGHDRLWTFHDPAVRVASVYGSGGDVDYLSHWTYSYPDPIRIGLCTDELLCMARGASRSDQRIMKMTQIIWYRSQTAPQPGEEAKAQSADFADKDQRPAGTGSIDARGRYQAAWEREIPDARFVTIAPMHLREAFWTKISYPIQGIMYHGWSSLVPLEHLHGSYRYTHAETKWELKRLVETVVQPLGPTLVQIPDSSADVAFLESFASQMFARRGTFGWNSNWEGDAFLILRYAGLQPRVIYDETIQQQGLKGFRILVMPSCDVLPQSVVATVQAFQQSGGIIIGDEHLCPAITPDILLNAHVRPKAADEARQLNVIAASALKDKLAARYKWYVSSSTPDIVTRVRRYRSTDYLFAVNDRREFGDYVGHHGLVMENGLPTDAELAIRRPGAHVYNLVTHREVTTHDQDGLLKIADSFGPCEGRVFMICDQAIDNVEIDAPASASPGDLVSVRVTVLGGDGNPLEAVVPIEILLLDPAGKAAEFSGHYGAKDGVVTVKALIAPNDTPGLWRIQVRELASGLTADAYLSVRTGF